MAARWFLKIALRNRLISGKILSARSKCHGQITPLVMVVQEKLTSLQQLLQFFCSMRVIEGLHGDINYWDSTGSSILGGRHVRIFSVAWVRDPPPLSLYPLALTVQRVPEHCVVTKDSVSTEWTTISFLGTRSFCRFNTCASSYPGLKAKALLVWVLR